MHYYLIQARWGFRQPAHPHVTRAVFLPLPRHQGRGDTANNSGHRKIQIVKKVLNALLSFIYTCIAKLGEVGGEKVAGAAFLADFRLYPFLGIRGVNVRAV